MKRNNKANVIGIEVERKQLKTKLAERLFDEQIASIREHFETERAKAWPLDARFYLEEVFAALIGADPVAQLAARLPDGLEIGLSDKPHREFVIRRKVKQPRRRTQSRKRVR